MRRQRDFIAPFLINHRSTKLKKYFPTEHLNSSKLIAKRAISACLQIEECVVKERNNVRIS